MKLRRAERSSPSRPVPQLDWPFIQISIDASHSHRIVFPCLRHVMRLRRARDVIPSQPRRMAASSLVCRIHAAWSSSRPNAELRRRWPATGESRHESWPISTNQRADAMSPAPTEVKVTLGAAGSGAVVNLAAQPTEPGQFASEPGNYADELRGHIDFQVDGKPGQATFSFR